jgi:hypothetical protein
LTVFGGFENVRKQIIDVYQPGIEICPANVMLMCSGRDSAALTGVEEIRRHRGFGFDSAMNSGLFRTIQKAPKSQKP